MTHCLRFSPEAVSVWVQCRRHKANSKHTVNLSIGSGGGSARFQRRITRRYNSTKKEVRVDQSLDIKLLSASHKCRCLSFNHEKDSTSRKLLETDRSSKHQKTLPHISQI
ncbi:hypothetical protein OPV22_029285 [Ensete ventricosum]|uniref:Uncharacterized protein n=1 Tax=Ensete ventricosum TaxID=4639 RepID=A0AAV8Q0P8_ENSVE|nr:hypothetical protein OPV22_029285 [Ensete ventricosum]